MQYRPPEFEIGDRLFLKITSSPENIRSGQCEKPSPQYVGPSDIIERVETLTCRFTLSLTLVYVYNAFHTSQLRKYASEDRLVPYYERLN